MDLEDKSTQRLENFLLMVIEEVKNEINDQSRVFKSPELKEELQRVETQAIIKVIVIKTMNNLQKKRAFNKKFISDIFGKGIEIEDDSEDEQNANKYGYPVDDWHNNLDGKIILSKER